MEWTHRHLERSGCPNSTQVAGFQDRDNHLFQPWRPVLLFQLAQGPPSASDMPHLVEVDVCHDQSRNEVPRWQHNEMMVLFLIWESAADDQELLIVERGSLFVQNALSWNELTSLEASDLFVEDV